MLKELDIENIAIIEKVSVEFSEGLNILTGETGAGKSIIIDSINAVTGEKTSRDLVRTGKERAMVSALFEGISDTVSELVESFGIQSEPDGSLLLRRSVSKDGKTSCHINGSAVTVSMLKSVGRELINIHGQRDSQSLLDSAKHISFLDEFAGTKEEAAEFREAYRRLGAVQTKIRSLKTDEAEKARRTDLLLYQINELENAGITVGERDELHKRKNILKNSARLSASLTRAVQCLSGDGENSGAYGLIRAAADEISSVAQFAKGTQSLSDALETAENIIDEATAAIEDVLGQFGTDENEIDRIEERLDLLYRLSKKYGQDEKEMLGFLEEAKHELESITHADETLAALYRESALILSECREKAEALSEKRTAAAKSLSAAVEEELRFLNMASCRFRVSVELCDLCDNGTDNVEFLISANKGEDFKPLGKVASGGELSRIMLAMKNVLTSSENVGTLIFDEIDTGVSGTAAGRIAEKLSSVSAHTQVLCITHLAQIAAFADSHKYIYKEEADGKTFTRIKELDTNGRANELARINFGENASDVQIRSAMQMITDAAEIKKHR